MYERVLLLNSNYMPLGTLPIYRAVNLLMGEKAYGVEGIEPARKLKTPSTVFEVPSVIVLKRYINVPSRDRKWSRFGVLTRDNYTCIFCGVTLGNEFDGRIAKKDDFTIEHLRPRAKGGKSTWGNTACACSECNHKKADLTTAEARSKYGMNLLWEPKTPRTNYWVASGEIPRPWKAFLRI